MKAYIISVVALVIISAIAGVVLDTTNPDAAQANLSQHGSTRL
jgi:hypothetical protein